MRNFQRRKEGDVETLRFDDRKEQKEEVEEKKKKFEMIRLPLIWTDMTSIRLKYLNTSGINEG